MTVRALDENGDIVTSGTQFISEKKEIAQTVSTRLSLFYGEYFRDITEGTPWMQVILDKATALPTKEGYLQSIILGTEGVERLLQFNTDFDIETREYSVYAAVLTIFGLIEIQQGGVA